MNTVVVKERPILFSGPMVQALLNNTKTQTRRIAQPAHDSVNPQHPPHSPFLRADGVWQWLTGQANVACAHNATRCPYGQPGDRLWVRETYYAFGSWSKRWNEEKDRDEWHFTDLTQERGYAYRYDEPAENVGHRRTEPGKPKWWKRPSIFMPRAASRLLLEITAVRVERVQDISEADAVAEGIEQIGEMLGMPAWKDYTCGTMLMSAQNSYRTLWESINGPESWPANPWVWVVEFKVIADGKEVARAN